MEIVGVVKEGKGSWTLGRFSRSVLAATAPSGKNHQIVI
jgi:hypothetical protein